MSQIEGTVINDHQPRGSVIYDSAGNQVNLDLTSTENVLETTSDEETVVPDFSNLSENYAGYDIYKSLYETGLQNIFDDYQKNIAILSQAKQKEVQDAYFIREMSKKYLGEYASNNGIGDVSGNLIDIYGSYQKNLNDINSNYEGLQMNLEQTYNQNKYAQFEKLMETQYNMNLAQLSSNAQQISFKLITGDTGGADAWEYLEAAKAQGIISEEDYMSIYGTYYTQQVTAAGEVLGSGFTTGTFGVDDEGNTITDPLDFVEYARTKYHLTDNDYASLKLQVETAIAGTTGSGITATNERTAQPNYDPTYYMSGTEDVGVESNFFTLKDEDGNQIGTTYVQIRTNVELEENPPRTVSFDELDEEFTSQTGSSNPTDDDIVMYKGTYYVSEGGVWYRLVSTAGGQAMADTAAENQSNWFITEDTANGMSSDGVFMANNKKADTITIMGVTYVEDARSKEFKNMTAEQQSAIEAAFNSVHGSKNQCVIFYQGRFWERNVHGKIVPMTKKTE